nr:MAG TPA: hypothetical protein [Bacteriophage sp.]
MHSSSSEKRIKSIPRNLCLLAKLGEAFLPDISLNFVDQHFNLLV